MIHGPSSFNKGLTILEAFILLAVCSILGVILVPVILVRMGVMTPAVPPAEAHEPVHLEQIEAPHLRPPSFGDITPPKLPEDSAEDDPS